MATAPFLLSTIIFFQITKSFWMAQQQWSQLIVINNCVLCWEPILSFLDKGIKRGIKTNPPNLKPFPLDVFVLTFVSASQKPLGSVKGLLGRHVLDGREMKATPALIICLFCPELEKVKLDVFVYLFDLVSYYQHTSAQKSKTALCISLGVHMLWLACFHATCE